MSDQEIELFLRLNAFRDHPEAQAVRHRDHSRGYRSVVGVDRELIDE